MKAINKNVLSVLNTLSTFTRIYCEKSKYLNRNYYTVLINRLTEKNINNLKSLLLDNNVSSIVIKDKDYLRVSVYLRNSAIKQKARIIMKYYVKHYSNNTYTLTRQFTL